MKVSRLRARVWRQLDLFTDCAPQTSAPADRWNDRRGGNEALTKAFDRKNITATPSGRYHFAVFDRGRFVGIASAPTLAVARAQLLARGAP